MRNIKNLRIVDASIMPTQISGTPNSAVIIIAEKAADMIKVFYFYFIKLNRCDNTSA